jgi:hypothetical protein
MGNQIGVSTESLVHDVHMTCDNFLCISDDMDVYMYCGTGRSIGLHFEVLKPRP